tara:strand:+ start:355 stop:594 length:240 start_codon:yes stop_codon:yes gene_type:complete
MHSPFNDESVPVCFATGQNGKEAERLNKFIWLRIGWLLDKGDEAEAIALMMEFADVSNRKKHREGCYGAVDWDDLTGPR